MPRRSKCAQYAGLERRLVAAPSPKPESSAQSLRCRRGPLFCRNFLELQPAVMVALGELAAQFATGLGFDLSMHAGGDDDRSPLRSSLNDGPNLLLSLSALVHAPGQQRGQPEEVRREILVRDDLTLVSRKAVVGNRQAKLPQPC